MSRDRKYQQCVLVIRKILEAALLLLFNKVLRIEMFFNEVGRLYFKF